MMLLIHQCVTVSGNASGNASCNSSGIDSNIDSGSTADISTKVSLLF